MEGLELIAFNIISSVGEARSKLMHAIKVSEQGNAELANDLVKEANKLITKGADEHLKIISEESKGNKVTLSLLLVHTEDQLMAAEIIRDLAENMIATNIKLYELMSKE